MPVPDIHPGVLLDYAGVLVFAATGALAAARKGHDFITSVGFAMVTGVGGGTLRDLLIGAPVFWIRDGGYFVVGLVAAARSGSWVRVRDCWGPCCGSMRSAWPAIRSSAPPRRRPGTCRPSPAS